MVYWGVPPAERGESGTIFTREKKRKFGKWQCDIIIGIIVTARFRDKAGKALRRNMEAPTNNKKIELWAGYEVEFDNNIANDYDFIQDLSSAVRNNDLAEITTLYFALIGGQKVFDDFRQHVIDEKGFFDIKEVQALMAKIDAQLPKAGNRAQRRSWQTSK